MRAIRFVARNLVFSDGVWALYRLAPVPYPGMSRAGKLDVFGALSGLLYRLERDVQILRVTARFSAEDYLGSVRAGLDPRHGHPEALERYLGSHAALLGGREIAVPEVYLAVLLRKEGSGLGALTRPGKGNLERLRDAVGLNDARAIPARELAEIERAESETHQRVLDFADARRARSGEIRWLILRAFGRGVAEPAREPEWRPQALVFEDEAGEALLEPLEHDVLRLLASPIHVGRRSLCVDLEDAESHQALLTLGDLPEEVAFPGSQAELLFAPLSSLDFPVDACIFARHVANREAVALVRRRIIDADNAFREEQTGEHGPTSHSAGRPHAARELEDYLTQGRRPPLLRSTISLAVGAPTEDELERRVEALRGAYGSVSLHRPIADQLRLFAGHLPGQHAPIPDYDDYRLVENIAAMVPTATHAVGTETGPYLGHTIHGGAQPVCFDLTAASTSARPPSILICGTLGSGKTLLLQTLLYQAFLLGSSVVDVDPKGDHRLEDLPGVAESMEVIELSGDPRYQGLLDPLVIAPREVAVDHALGWLSGLLPGPVDPAWQTELRRAVIDEVADDEPTSSGVVARLTESPEGRPVARALSPFAEGGLSGLGFARPGQGRGAGARAQVTSLRIRNLPRPLPGTPRGEMSEEERVGQAVLRLVATYAMHVVGRDRTRHKVVGLDEAFFLLEDAQGHRLVEQLNRWGRSEFATPILVTHLVSDAEALDNLLGARIFMGQESDAEAARALALLHLDPDDRGARQRLLTYRRGACMLRDFEGRVGEVQVHVPDEAMLSALDTTPGRGAR